MLYGDWDKLAKILTPLEVKRSLLDRCMALIGAYVSTEIKKRIREGRYAPNHPFTLGFAWTFSAHTGKGPIPLIDTGQLLKSITYKVLPSGATSIKVFVGIIMGTKSKDGKSLVKLGEVLHDGRLLEVTDKMRYWLHAHGLHLKASTTHIIIPPRRFIKDVLDDPIVVARVREIYIKSLRDIILKSGGLTV